MGRPKEFQRDTVIGKSLQIFWRNGFSKTSLHDLEKATGLNKSSLYLEFEGKDDLYHQCLLQYLKLNMAVETLTQKPLGLANIESFLMLGQNRLGQKGCFVVNSLREVGALPASSKNVIVKNAMNVRSILIENLKAQPITIDVDSAADLILALNSGFCLEQNLGRSDCSEKIRSFLALLA